MSISERTIGRRLKAAQTEGYRKGWEARALGATAAQTNYREEVKALTEARDALQREIKATDIAHRQERNNARLLEELRELRIEDRDIRITTLEKALVESAALTAELRRDLAEAHGRRKRDTIHARFEWHSQSVGPDTDGKALTSLASDIASGRFAAGTGALRAP